MSVIVKYCPYAELEFPQTCSTITFPDNFNQAIRPASIPKFVKIVRFNDEFNTILEPGVITENIDKVIFGKAYRQKIDPSIIPSSTRIYIFYRNLDTIDPSRSVIVYNDDEKLDESLIDDTKWKIITHPMKKNDNYQCTEVISEKISLRTSYLVPNNDSSESVEVLSVESIEQAALNKYNEIINKYYVQIKDKFIQIAENGRIVPETEVKIRCFHSDRPNFLDKFKVRFTSDFVISINYENYLIVRYSPQ